MSRASSAWNSPSARTASRPPRRCSASRPAAFASTTTGASIPAGARSRSPSSAGTRRATAGCGSERAGAGWRVDGAPRPDLDGAEEPDLSVTPFCNSFPIRRTPEAAGASLTLDTAFIDGPALTVARSSQRYDRRGPGRVRYVDLGLSRGFEADLVVDADGLVLSYQHLFERVAPAA